MRSGLVTGIAAAAFVLMGTPTLAQTGEPFRGFVSINGGYQASSTDFRDSIAFTEFVEQGSVDSSYNGQVRTAIGYRRRSKSMALVGDRRRRHAVQQVGCGQRGWEDPSPILLQPASIG